MTFKLETNGGRLTPRDKKLLFLLAVVFIVGVAGYGIIRPLFVSNGQLREQIAQAQEEKQENEEKVVLVTQYRINNEKLKQELEQVSGRYFAWMESQQIDAKLTQTALQYGLQAQALDIQMPQDEADMQDLAPYVNSEQAQQAASDADDAQAEETQEQTDSSDAEEPSASATKDVKSGLYTAVVSMQLQGARDQLQSLLDSYAAQQPAVRVTGFQWNTASVVGADGALTEVATLTLNMELYMIKNTEEIAE